MKPSKPVKRMKPSYLSFLGSTFVLNLLLALGCGVKGPPLPPIDTTPQATETSETLLLKKNASSQSPHSPKVRPSGQPVQQSTDPQPQNNPLSPNPAPSSDPQKDDR